MELKCKRELLVSVGETNEETGKTSYVSARPEMCYWHKPFLSSTSKYQLLTRGMTESREHRFQTDETLEENQAKHHVIRINNCQSL